MKAIPRLFVIEFIGLYFANEIAQGLQFQDGLFSVILTSLALAVAMRLLKPIVSVLLLPLTLATLGLFKFLTHAVTLYVVDVALTQFSVNNFNYPGLTSPYLDLPSVQFGEGVMAYIAFSLLISIITSLIHWIVK
jgi:uncharacterized membrane protein YvlD (DUF360 family)